MENRKRGLCKSRAPEIQSSTQNFGSTKPSDFQAIEASEYLKNTTLWKGLSQYLLAEGEADVNIVFEQETTHD